MYTPEALLDLHERCHRNLEALLVHCEQLSPEQLNQELPGFGYPSVRLQLHHQLGAQRYWIGVLEGRLDIDEDDPDYPTVAALRSLREAVFALTEHYLRGTTTEQLSTPRTMLTWGNNERMLMPAHVVLRTQTHLYHHQGQILAMCRLHGLPASGLDFPLL